MNFPHIVNINIENMKVFILTLLLSFSTWAQTGCLDADIILVADLSGSVKGQETFIADAADVFINRFDLWEHGIRIGMFVFSNETFLISHLTSDKDALLGATNLIRNNPLGTSTNLANAIDNAYNEYVKNGRKGETKRIMILISDGRADVPDTFYIAADRIKKDLGVIICGIYVHTFSGDRDSMESVSTSSCYVASNYEELAGILERLNICG